MARITQIDVRIKTKNWQGAGTDGKVYLGICGRELLLDNRGKPGADFERDLDQTFTLGKDSNSLYPDRSDPRTHSLDTGDLDRFPMWIRFKPEGSNDDWIVEAVLVTVNPGSSEEKYERFIGSEYAELGKPSGRYWFLLNKSKP